MMYPTQHIPRDAQSIIIANSEAALPSDNMERELLGVTTPATQFINKLDVPSSHPLTSIGSLLQASFDANIPSSLHPATNTSPFEEPSFASLLLDTEIKTLIEETLDSGHSPTDASGTVDIDAMIDAFKSMTLESDDSGSSSQLLDAEIQKMIEGTLGYVEQPTQRTSHQKNLALSSLHNAISQQHEPLDTGINQIAGNDGPLQIDNVIVAERKVSNLVTLFECLIWRLIA